MKNYLLKGSLYLITGQIFSRVLTFFYSLFLARSLGVEGFGVYTVALSFYSFLSALSDFGFSRYQTREIAKYGKKSIEAIFPQVLAARLLFAFILFALFSISLFLFDYDKARVSISILALAAVFPQAIGITFESIFMALQKTLIPAVAQTLMNVSAALIGAVLLMSGWGPEGAIIGLFLSLAIYSLILIVVIWRLRLFKLKFTGIKIDRKIISGSLPYGLLAVMGIIYFKIDTVLLSYFKGSYDAGIYSAAYRFLEAVIFVPAIISQVLFAPLSRMHDKSISDVKKLSYKIIKVMAVIGSAVAVVFIVLLPKFINAYLPAFYGSVDAVIILSFAIPFIFIHIPLSQVALSSEKYLKQILLISVINMTFNITANLLFVPKFGYIAAAIVTVLSDIFSLVTLLYIIQRYILKK